MNNKQWDGIWINGTLATFESGYDLIEEGAIAVRGDKIAWVGKMQDLPGNPKELAHQVIDVNGNCITPGLIDCHTHIVYAGNRAHEFEMRLQGVSYEEIARAGGGIHSTVSATRAASEAELFSESAKRINALLQEGVTTLEIKSGYGLDLETELKILHVAKRISETFPVTISKTFLGAHSVPKEFHGRADEYIDFLCEKMLPTISQLKLAESVDVFCETIGFNIQQTEKVFQTAQQFGLNVKCHAEQLSDSGGAILAAKYQALSVDHLEFLTEKGIQALAESGTVAVLLPGAFYFLREKKLPPIDLLREYKVPIAIATDCNPGTSPVTSLLLMLNMACTLFRLTPEEALLGVTHYAAKALGMQTLRGTLTSGKQADFVVWNVSHPVELVYQIGLNPCLSIIKKGIIST